MNDEVKRRLFEPFFTTKPVGRGTGLGLATIFGAVKQAGGFIEVHSEIDQGTTFKLYLPRTDARPEKLVVEPPARDLPRGRETVLLVENETSVRELAREILQRLGYKVLDAGGGMAALALVEASAEPIDLLMTDVVMPGMSGGPGERAPAARGSGALRLGYTEGGPPPRGVIEQARLTGSPTGGALAKKIRGVLGSLKRGTMKPERITRPWRRGQHSVSAHDHDRRRRAAAALQAPQVKGMWCVIMDRKTPATGASRCWSTRGGVRHRRRLPAPSCATPCRPSAPCGSAQAPAHRSPGVAQRRPAATARGGAEPSGSSR
jgi:hypothetical protein